MHTQLITWTFDLARPSFGTTWAKLQLFKRRRLPPAKNTNKAIRQGARIQNSRESSFLSMAPPQDTRRPFKRLAISDQQRRRDISLQRQAQSRRDAQHQARCLASTVLSLQQQTTPEPESNIELELVPESEESEAPSQDLDVRHAAKLKGAEARKWFAKQLMLHEWMIDVPDRLSDDWSFFNLT